MAHPRNMVRIFWFLSQTHCRTKTLAGLPLWKLAFKSGGFNRSGRGWFEQQFGRHFKPKVRLPLFDSLPVVTNNRQVKQRLIRDLRDSAVLPNRSRQGSTRIWPPVASPLCSKIGLRFDYGHLVPVHGIPRVFYAIMNLQLNKEVENPVLAKLAKAGAGHYKIATLQLLVEQVGGRMQVLATDSEIWAAISIIESELKKNGI